MKIELKVINFLIFVFLTAAILINMISLKSQRYGDGNEYYLMLESLRNHLSPDLQKGDIDHSYNGERNAFGEKADPYWGYFKGKDQHWYSQHFWAYSLFSLPVKVGLALVGVKESKTLQITNALLYALTLLVINFFSKFEEQQKLFFVLLLTFSPALWFIHWTHPEIFILCWVTISLICLHSNKNGGAIISAGIASWQNQGLALFVLFLVIKAVWTSHFKIKALIQYGALSSLVFLPNLFYLMVFGRFNPLSDAAATANISLFRIFETFFDLNIGLLPYIPLSLLLFFGLIVFRTHKEGVFAHEFQLCVLVIALLMVCSATENWNHGTSGPSRYLIWIFPFIFYIMVINLKTLWGKSLLRYFLLSAIFLQVIIVVSGGPFVHGEDYLEHSTLAKFVLNRFPGLYNPSFEIFCERTLKSESDCADPTIYKHQGNCKKALVTCNGLRALESVCGNTNRNFERYCKDHNDQWFYVNY
jgi:hypothetical protein